MTSPKLIVIDDEKGVQDILVDVLSSKGYCVEVASSGEEGLRKLSDDFYNVAILDVRLQDMTGIEVMEEMEELSPDTEVILMTAYASVDTAIKAVKGNAFDYIAKPFKVEKLLDALEGAMRYQDLKMQNKRMFRQMGFLNEISGEMVTTLSINTILERVLEKTLDFFKIKSGAIYTQDQESWVLIKERGVSEKFKSSFERLSPDHSIVKEARERQLAIVKRTGSDNGERMLASVPFLFGNRVMGILVLAGKGSELLDEEDRNLLTIMGAQVGTILNNAMTFERIERTRSYLQNLVENTADAIITYDLKGRVIGWNQAATELYGYEEKEAIGKALVSIPESMRGEAMGMFEEVRSGKLISNYETKRKRKDGDMVDVAITLSPLKDASGKLVGFSSISRDLTSQKEAERERFRSEVLEAQGRIRDVLIDVIPLLLKRRLPVEDRNEFVLTLSRKLEEALYDDYVSQSDENTRGIARSITAVLNDMGGEFEYEIDGDVIHIRGLKCPWMNEQRKNPVICMLTKSISARFAKRGLGDVRVSLEGTLANGDDCCHVIINQIDTQ
jgi:PAS domain S-box-containing protein